MFILRTGLDNAVARHILKYQLIHIIYINAYFVQADLVVLWGRGEYLPTSSLLKDRTELLLSWTQYNFRTWASLGQGPICVNGRIEDPDKDYSI